MARLADSVGEARKADRAILLTESLAACEYRFIVNSKTRFQFSVLSHRHHHGHISGPCGAVV
jgi:hypothetical protein